ncbi:L-rhamnose mutarotase [Pedobacter sp. GSP4]|uniref:L-rhamnose mutarotase n=1 Tax=Pedobacter sp. GSP4 TaxID=3453716 RepID=UPI003EE86B95
MKTTYQRNFLVFIVLGIITLLACTQNNQSTTAPTQAKVMRYGSITGLKPDKIEAYKKLHAAVWPGVLKQIKACNIKNYSIYLKEIDGKPYLFSYFEYEGNDFTADMKKMAADTTTQRWWKETAPLQIPLPDAAAKKETWSQMEEVFHQD